MNTFTVKSESWLFNTCNSDQFNLHIRFLLPALLLWIFYTTAYQLKCSWDQLIGFLIDVNWCNTPNKFDTFLLVIKARQFQVIDHQQKWKKSESLMTWQIFFLMFPLWPVIPLDIFCWKIIKLFQNNLNAKNNNRLKRFFYKQLINCVANIWCWSFKYAPLQDLHATKFSHFQLITIFR